MPFTTSDNAISNFRPTNIGSIVLPKHPMESKFPPLGELMGSWFRRSTGETIQGVKSFFQNLGFSPNEEWSNFDPYPFIPEDLRDLLPNLNQYWHTSNPEEVQQVNNILRSQINDYRTIQDAGAVGWLGHVATSVLDPAFLVPGAALSILKIGRMAEGARRLNRMLYMIEKPGKLAKLPGWENAANLAAQLGEYAARSGVYDYPHWLQQAGIYAAEGGLITTAAEAIKLQAPTLKTWSQGLENIAINSIASAVLGTSIDSFGRARLARFRKGIRRDFKEAFSEESAGSEGEPFQYEGLKPKPRLPRGSYFGNRSDIYDIVERSFPGEQGRQFVTRLKQIPKGELTKKLPEPPEPEQTTPYTREQLINDALPLGIPVEGRTDAEILADIEAVFADIPDEPPGIQRDIDELSEVLEPEELKEVLDAAGIPEPTVPRGTSVQEPAPLPEEDLSKTFGSPKMGTADVLYSEDPLGYGKPGLELTRLKSVKLGFGNGTKLLNQVKEYADDNGLPVILEARAYQGGGISQKDLVKWYEKRGFKVFEATEDASIMVYDPAVKVKPEPTSLPEELKSLSENAAKLPNKAAFLKAFNDRLNQQNLTKREVAQRIDAYMRRNLKITPEEFYDRYVIQQEPAPAVKPVQEAQRAESIQAIIDRITMGGEGIDDARAIINGYTPGAKEIVIDDLRKRGAADGIDYIGMVGEDTIRGKKKSRMEQMKEEIEARKKARGKSVSEELSIKESSGKEGGSTAISFTTSSQEKFDQFMNILREEAYSSGNQESFTRQRGEMEKQFASGQPITYSILGTSKLQLRIKEMLDKLRKLK